MDNSAHDVLADRAVPAQHRQTLHRTHTLDRLTQDVKRRPTVVGIFPNAAALLRLIGAVLLEPNDDGQTQQRYMQVEPMAELMSMTTEPQPAQRQPRAAGPGPPCFRKRLFTRLTDVIDQIDRSSPPLTRRARLIAAGASCRKCGLASGRIPGHDWRCLGD